MGTKVIWSSNYGLMESEESNEGWDVNVAAFDDGTIYIDIAQPGEDVHKEFTSVEDAYEWLMEFTKGQFLDSCGEFDFRETVY